MDKHMTGIGNHLSEEDLIDHYYGESATASHMERHLKVCVKCAGRYSALERDLGSVQPLVPPARGEGYGEEVWRSIRGSLPVYEVNKRSWPGLGFTRPLLLATACALLMVAAFIAGRVWQGRHTVQTAAIAPDPQARQRVVIWVLGDHLDRSERLLVELNHANGKDATEVLPIQSEARDLLASNRLLRQSARQSGDPQLDAALDRLERLLVEIANQPNGLTDANLTRLRQEMNTGGLLFDVRVLRSRVAERQPNAATGLKGVSI
jgi:hypothetical protein